MMKNIYQIKEGQIWKDLAGRIFSVLSVCNKEIDPYDFVIEYSTAEFQPVNEDFFDYCMLQKITEKKNKTYIPAIKKIRVIE